MKLKCVLILSISFTNAAVADCQALIGSWLCGNDETIYTFSQQQENHFLQTAENKNLGMTVENAYLCRGNALVADHASEGYQQLMQMLDAKGKKAYAKNPGSYVSDGPHKATFEVYDFSKGKVMQYRCQKTD